MAIYHFSAQVISRSQGRSVVAAAAYRSAEKLHDEKLEKSYNFTKKNDVVAKEILLPENAPIELKDRATLWNKVEQKESRKDAQLAREINISLPRELNEQQNWQLAKDFVQQTFVDKGMIADLTMHAGHITSNENQEPQPHAHVMLTMREITEEGFGQKVRDWNNKELLKTWREHWAERCNLELARHGHDVQIDHRTLEAQGLNLEPQTKIGPKESFLQMVRFAEHQELAKRNGERLTENPELALEAITRQQSTFTEHDVARFVNRHTIDEEQFTKVFELVTSSPEIVSLGRDDRNIHRYTTGSMLEVEKSMLKNAQHLNNANKHAVAKENPTSEVVNKYFTPEQKAAYKHILENKDLACVVGYAGTGKSFMLKAAQEVWHSHGYNVIGATLSGIAAESLEGGSGIKSHTIANRLWHWERGRENLTSKDILVIDEAGMLGSRQMATILKEVTNANAKVVLIGDPEQLQAIDAGAAFRAIAQEVGASYMTDIRRQQAPWQKQATIDFAEDRTKEGLTAYEEHDNIHKFETKAAAIKNMVEQWDEVRSQQPEKSQIMLAYTRAEVKELNNYARSLYKYHDELGEDYGVKTSRGIRDFATGDRVYFLRNENHNLHVKNGTLGTIKELDGRNFTIELDKQNAKGNDIVQFNIQDYRDIEYGYAATVHKAQGITVDRSYILASKYFDKHATYVAMSRHKEGADLYYSKDEFFSLQELSKTIGRERAKDTTLDYAASHNITSNENELLQANNIELKQTYSAILTEERLQQAEDRLAERLHQMEIKQDMVKLSERLELDLSLEIKHGDKGYYIGKAEIAGKEYGVIQQNDTQAKLMPLENFNTREKGERVTIEKSIDNNGQEHTKGIQPEVQQRQLSRGFEIGGFSR